MFFGLPNALMANAEPTGSTKAMGEAMQTYKEAWTRQVELLKSAEWPFALEWREVDWQNQKVSIPTMSSKTLSPEWTRDAFHTMSDINMRQWEHAADMLQSLPDWAKWAYRAPSNFWANWFDQWIRLGEEAQEEFMAASETVAAAVVPAAEVKAVDKPAPKPKKKKAPKAVKKDPAIPELLKKANGTADDLTVIKGIGVKLNERLNELGIFHLSQIAKLTPEQVNWIDSKMDLKGRIQRDAWVDQATAL